MRYEATVDFIDGTYCKYDNIDDFTFHELGVYILKKGNTTVAYFNASQVKKIVLEEMK